MATRNEHLRAREEPIGVGDEAPDFTLMDQDKGEWTLSEALKQGDVVLCFYPMDFSPVCETEMKCVTDEMSKFERSGAQVVGVSCDSFFTHKAWADQLGLSQTLLADMHREVCKAYGFYFPDLNTASRGTVVIGKDDAGKGKVKWVQSRDIPEAMAAGDVLSAVS
jgi:peroxiredoxin